MASLQIRHVPDDVHRRLKTRAAMAGMSLSEYALAELVRAVQRPTIAELNERIRALPPIDLGDGAVTAVREGRNDR